MEPELKRLRAVEKVALHLAVREAIGDPPEVIAEAARAFREVIGEDVVEAAVDAVTAGLEEP